MKRGLALLIAVVLALLGSSRSCLGGGELLTSDTCGECHKEIYRLWRASAHARSMEEDPFLQAFRETEAVEGAGVARVCLRCHAPLAAVTGDWEIEKKVTWEGVNCDVCHSIVSVELSDGSAKQTLDVGEVKRGPIEDAVPAGHDVIHSELHSTSLVCAGCHEYANREGTPILTTYSEWEKSEAAGRGETCMDCHMSRMKGNVVDPRISRAAHAEINLHEVPGSHSIDMLNKALGVSVESRRDGDELEVTVRLSNRGAAHAVPTGMPGRRIILDLQVRSYDGRTFSENKVYGKFFTDSEGETIKRDSRYFTEGVHLESDSRIRSDERRIERFRFPIPHDVMAGVKLRLHYEHDPIGGGAGRTRRTFYSESRTIAPKG